MAEESKKKVLVVDDESPIADMLAEFCELLGFETKVLNRGEGVVDTAKSYRPDLITLDLVMPDFSGIEVLEELKADEETKSIPVIIVSGIVGGDSTERILKLSQGVLQKPVRIGSLKEKINAALTAR